MTRKIIIGLLLVVVVMQFIRPPKNQAEGISENDISLTYGMPQAVHNILAQKCYDCHSNRTVYPWYTNVQPIGWWMYFHIREGKEHLNFSEFKAYSEKKADNKLEEMSEAVTDGWMPLESYLWMHSESKVTPKETAMINNWIQSLGVSVKGQEE